MPSLRSLMAEASIEPRRFVFLTVASATSTVLLLAIVNMAVGVARSGFTDLRLAFLFLIGIALFATMQRQATFVSAAAVEGLVDRLRATVVEDIRKSDLQSPDEIGHAAAFSALTRDCQTILRAVPLLVVGGQQAVMLGCVALYLAWLSLAAFAAIAIFLAAETAIHWRRMADLQGANERALTEEMDLFAGLGGLLNGLKEIRLNDPRAEQAVEDLAEVSRRTRAAKSRIKTRRAREFAAIQLVFYVLVGLMVFVVPMFTTDFHNAAVQVTTAALFMIGPIGTVVQAVPAIGDANRTLAVLYALKDRLCQGNGAVPQNATPLPAQKEIAGRSRLPRDSGLSGNQFPRAGTDRPLHAGTAVFRCPRLHPGRAAGTDGARVGVIPGQPKLPWQFSNGGGRADPLGDAA